MRKISPLDYDPFDADFGSADDITFSDKMVNARKEHECCNCKGKIKKQELYRYIVGKFDDEIHTYKYCAECCAAMVFDVKNGVIDKLEKRIDMYQNKEKK
jgi:hypothetical protein